MIVVRNTVSSAVTRAVYFLARNWILILGLALLMLVFFLASYGWEFWAEITYNADGSIKETKLDRARVFQQIGIVILGAPALAFAVWRSWTAHRQAGAAIVQADTASRNQVLDRYTNAAHLIDSEKMSVRTAGALAFVELAKDHAEQYYSSAITLLNECARDVAKKAASNNDATYDEFEFMLLQITQIRKWAGKRDAEFHQKRIRLRAITVKDVVLYGCNLSDATFSDAKFENVHFIRIDLERSYFNSTDLSRSRFSTCDLTNAEFPHSILKEARFYECNISGADFTGALNADENTFNGAWAWSDKLPKLPDGISEPRLVHPGEKGEIRRRYDAGKLSSIKYYPPDAE